MVKTGIARPKRVRLCATNNREEPHDRRIPRPRRARWPGDIAQARAGAAAPHEIVQSLTAEVRKALATPNLHQRFAEPSLSVTPSSPEELDTLIRSEAVRWGDVIPRASIGAPE